MGVYIVLKDNRVVERIDAPTADAAYAEQKQVGPLYVKCGPPIEAARYQGQEH